MENNQNHSENCCHHNNGCYGYHKHLLVRIILGLFILGIVFWLGVKIGEFKGEIRAGAYGFGGEYGRHMRGFKPMMYGNFEYKIPTSTPR